MTTQKIILSIATLVFARLTYAECLLDGKPIEYSNPNVQAKLDGHVECTSKDGSGTKTEKYDYKNGEKLAEVIDGPNQHHEWKFLPGSHASRRDGKQVDYHPNGKVKSIQFFEKGDHAGKEQNFYDNGQLQNISVYGIPPGGRSAQQYGTISYHKNGEISYINCSPYQNANPDPKLCGFGGDSVVKKTDGKGNVVSEVTFKNGVASTEATKVNNKYEEYGSNITVGFLKEPKRDKVVENKRSDGSSEMQYLYADGKVKRHYYLKDNVFVDEDTEYFPSGKKVRLAVFGQPEGKGSQKHPVLKSNQCWWENGKPRFDLKVLPNNSVDVKSWWSNGKLMHSGAYNIAGENTYWNLSLDDFIDCDMFAWMHQEGRHQYFAEDGKNALDCNFKDGKQDGNCKEFDKDGLLEKDSEYKAGTLVSSKEYKAGKFVRSHEYYSDGSEKSSDDK